MKIRPYLLLKHKVEIGEQIDMTREISGHLQQVSPSSTAVQVSRCAYVKKDNLEILILVLKQTSVGTLKKKI